MATESSWRPLKVGALVEASACGDRITFEVVPDPSEVAPDGWQLARSLGVKFYVLVRAAADSRRRRASWDCDVVAVEVRFMDTVAEERGDGRWAVVAVPGVPLILGGRGTAWARAENMTTWEVLG